MTGAHVMAGPCAIVAGREAATIAAIVGEVLGDAQATWRLIRSRGLVPADIARLREAEAALRAAGEEWRRAPVADIGDAATRGDAARARSVPMSTRDAARLIGLSERTVRGLALTGDLPAERVGRGYVFDRVDVAAFAESRCAAA